MLERQLERLGREYPAAPESVTLRLEGGEGDPSLGPELERLARKIVELAGPSVSIEDAVSGGNGPALSLAAEGRGRVRYRAMPEEREAEVFVDLVLAMADREGVAPKTLDLASPAEILVFVSPFCPHCARTVRSACEAALANAHVTVEIVDATRFPDLAERYRVKSVPVTILDGGESLSGAQSTRDLTERLLTRGSPERETAAFASMVEAGRFPDLVARVLDGDGVRWFAAVWLGSTLQIRMGLMVAAEMILERAPDALDGLVEPILPALDEHEPGPRGDTADLLGKIAHPAATEALHAHRDDPHPDVAEAVQEALEAIEKRA